MITSSSIHPHQPPKTQRKLIIEVINAKDLLPKDGQGSSSPYVVVEFDGHKKRTSTVYRNLNPEWNEMIEFDVPDPNTMEYEELEIMVFNDKKLSHGNMRKNQFLGRVKLYGSQFKRKGEEGLVYYQLEKKSVFSWIRGELGLRIYYYDEVINEQINDDSNNPPPEKEKEPPFEAVVGEDGRVMPSEIAMEGSQLPPMVTIEESPPVVTVIQPEHNHHHRYHYHQEGPARVEQPEVPPPLQQPQPEYYPGEVRKIQTTGRGGGESERGRLYARRPINGGDYAPKVINNKFNGESERIIPPPVYGGLVEPMQYLFIRIVKARGLHPNAESPYVKIRTSSHFVRSKPASHSNPEWNQVFALSHNKLDACSSTLEISVWDSP